jgi:hypothetical protein
MKSKDFMKTRETHGLNHSETLMDEIDPLSKYLDGMGTVTARIIINRHLADDHWEKYGLKELKNTGRYYVARVLEKDGKTIDEVLIDKQTGKIQSLHSQTGMGS